MANDSPDPPGRYDGGTEEDLLAASSEHHKSVVDPLETMQTQDEEPSSSSSDKLTIEKWLDDGAMKDPDYIRWVKGHRAFENFERTKKATRIVDGEEKHFDYNKDGDQEAFLRVLIGTRKNAREEYMRFVENKEEYLLSMDLDYYFHNPTPAQEICFQEHNPLVEELEVAFLRSLENEVSAHRESMNSRTFLVFSPGNSEPTLVTGEQYRAKRNAQDHPQG